MSTFLPKLERHFRELFWVVPLLFLGLFALALLRSVPVLPPQTIEGGTVTISDGRRDTIVVPSPPQAVAMAYLPSYLTHTHAPKLWRRAGNPQDRKGFAESLRGRLFPEVLAEKYWFQGVGTFEAALAFDVPGHLYFLSGNSGFGHDARVLREMGFMAIGIAPSYPTAPAVLEQMGLDEDEYRMIVGIRVQNAALGQVNFGEEIIAEYLRGMARLREELQPDLIPEKERPRVAGLGASASNWAIVRVSSDDNPHLATRDAKRGLAALGREQDAERALAMNPDIIMLWGESVENFYLDPRWRGLKAVRERRVYNRNTNFCGYIHDVDNLPLSNRWLAEIFHPSRLSVGELRGRIREHYRVRYHYEMSDDYMDELLQVPGNKGSAGYARFERGAAVGKGDGVGEKKETGK